MNQLTKLDGTLLGIVIASATALAALAVPGEAFAQSCPAGYPVYCGSFCCPSNLPYCCPNNPQSSECSSNGNCGGSGGTCPPGYPVDCNNGHCCPSGTTCLANGQCGTSSGSGGSTGSGGCADTASCAGDVCVSQSIEGCSDVKSCAGAGYAYYLADGKRFNCSGTSCQEAAQQVVDYCNHPGCSMAPEGTGPGEPMSPGRFVSAAGIPSVLGTVLVARRPMRRLTKALVLATVFAASTLFAVSWARQGSEIESTQKVDAGETAPGQSAR